MIHNNIRLGLDLVLDYSLQFLLCLCFPFILETLRNFKLGCYVALGPGLSGPKSSYNKTMALKK